MCAVFCKPPVLDCWNNSKSFVAIVFTDCSYYNNNFPGQNNCNNNFSTHIVLQDNFKMLYYCNIIMQSPGQLVPALLIARCLPSLPIGDESLVLTQMHVVGYEYCCLLKNWLPRLICLIKSRRSFLNLQGSWKTFKSSRQNTTLKITGKSQKYTSFCGELRRRQFFEELLQFFQQSDSIF